MGIPFIIALAAYLVAALTYFLLRFHNAQSLMPLARGAFAVGAIAHFLNIGSQCTTGAHPFSSIHLATSFGAMVLVVGYLLISNRQRPMMMLGVVFAPIVILALWLGELADIPDPSTATLVGPLVQIHVVSAILGTAGFTLATGVAGLYLSMTRRLRNREFQPGPTGMSLVGLDRLHYWIVVVTTGIMSVGLLTGFMIASSVSGGFESRSFDLVAAGLGWGAGVAVSLSRVAWGLRGRLAAWLTIVAFLSLVGIVVSYGVRS